MEGEKRANVGNNLTVTMLYTKFTWSPQRRQSFDKTRNHCLSACHAHARQIFF